MSSSSTTSTTTLVTAAVATVAVGVLGYAAYFDYRRRHDPEFRRELRRTQRRQERAEKHQAEANATARKQAIRDAVDEAKAEGFPGSAEEKEAFFLEQVQEGEQLAANPSKHLEAALAFYKALKVYPTPGDLINIYDKTVSKPILDILAEMIAYDTTLRIGTAYTGPDVADLLREMAANPGVGLD
ncbi:hypothetical protein VTJ49DRAFT_1167 [Mycothermus thermophilus]|uniref:Uncharacterized protein n=1 Tax=Humicola insolens TaxID=85995 RepID=A0ABR3VEU6_HUMIN